MKKRSHRQEKMARVYDEEILPIWSVRFGRWGTGYPALELR